ncbi:hypothetical protein EVG20_g1232 [Dentipellis fragilis]|uniref:C2 domain-containing protein n=1 Tax=Dentipellis fragilis TaxID=205917 RepID=A0A4Y9ZB43_9AGAM|nr:hypothetical protein EVG20_g1232 [Dentipellis fragilis]
MAHKSSELPHKSSEPYSGKNPIPKMTTDLKSLVSPQRATEAKARQLESQSESQSHQQEAQQDEKDTEDRTGQMAKGHGVRVHDPTTGEDVEIKNAPKDVSDIKMGTNVLKLELPEPDWSAHRDDVLKNGLQSIRILSVTYALSVLVLFLPIPFLRRSFVGTVVRLALAFIPAGFTTSFLIKRLNNTALSSASAHAWHSERIRGERAGADVHNKGKIGADERVHESAEWANAIVAAVWPIMNPALFASLVDMLEDIMQGSVPSFVHSVRVSDLGLGSNPMRVTSIRALPDMDTEDVLETLDGEERDQLAGDHVNLELSFAYNALPSGHSAESKAHNAHLLIDFFLGLQGVWGFKVPVWAELRGVVGTARLRFQIIPDPPFIKTTMFTLMGLPRMSIAVTVLSRAMPNVMNIPFISGFISSSLNTAAAEYIAPKSLILDMQRLIGGGDITKDTQAVGVIVIHIHRATGMKKMDTTGSSADPYVTLTYSRLGKPLFSTRIIKNELNPVFEETAILPVDVNVVKLKESLSLQVWDSDRTSADDMMGSCDVDIVDLIREKNIAKRRITPLSTVSESSELGTIEYTIGYYSKRFPNTALRTDGRDPGIPADVHIEGASGGAGRREGHRAQRSGARCARVSARRRVGGREGAAGHEGLAHMVRRKWDGAVESAKGQDEEGEMEEGEGMPSSYCSISLNDEMVYETRVKPITSSPIFNAGTERFVRDWRSAHITVSVKDSRLRESDAVLGILSELLVNASQLTRVYHLEHGIGHGRIRISVVFRPVSVKLPPQLQGFDIGTLRVRDVRIQADQEHHEDLMKCEARLKLSTGSADEKVSRRPTAEDGAQVVWHHEGKPTELPVMQRYSAALLASFRASGIRSGRHAMAALWLRDLVDRERTTVEVALFASEGDAAFARLKQNYVPMDGNLSAWVSESDEQCGPGLERIGTVVLDVEFLPGVSEAHRGMMGSGKSNRGRWEEVEREAKEGGREDVGVAGQGDQQTASSSQETVGRRAGAAAGQDLQDKPHQDGIGAGKDAQDSTRAPPEGRDKFETQDSTTATTGHGEGGRGGRSPEAPSVESAQPGDGQQYDTVVSHDNVEVDSVGHGDDGGTSEGESQDDDQQKQGGGGKKHRGPMKKFRDWKEKEKELHMDHRGMMQMKGARTAVWMKDSMHDAAHSVKDKFKMEGRQPDVETEV